MVKKYWHCKKKFFFVIFLKKQKDQVYVDGYEASKLKTPYTLAESLTISLLRPLSLLHTVTTHLKKKSVYY